VTTHTFQFYDPERWVAAVEELRARGIGLTMSSGRVEVRLDERVTGAEAEAWVNQAIEENLARKRRRRDRAKGKKLRKARKDAARPLLHEVA
jgi:hypothetical protein